MASILLDYGHGGTDPGAVYKGRKEADDVLAIGKAIAQELRRHGVTVDETRTTDRTVSLQDRCKLDYKKKYDYFISVHRNAFKVNKASGAEVFTYLKSTGRAAELASLIQKGLVAVGFKDRGVKRANYMVLRDTQSAAVLIEIGFIDNDKDNELYDLKKSAIVNNIASAILGQLKKDGSLIKTVSEKDCVCAVK